MSVHISSRVWRMEMGSAIRKLVMLKLADNANDEGYCYPSVATVARECEIDERTARRTIRALERAGLLKTEIRRRNGGRTSNGYHIHLPAEGGGRLPPPSGHSASSPLAQHPHPGGAVPPRTTIQTISESSIQPRLLHKRRLCFRGDLDEGLRATAELAVLELPAELAQQVIDEWTGRVLDKSVRSPQQYIKTLVQRAMAGNFVPVKATAERQRREAYQRDHPPIPSRPVGTGLPEASLSTTATDVRKTVEALAQKWRGDSEN